MSIRAYGCQERMVQQNMMQLDNNNKAYLTLQATNQWYEKGRRGGGSWGRSKTEKVNLAFLSVRKDHRRKGRKKRKTEFNFKANYNLNLIRLGLRLFNIYLINLMPINKLYQAWVKVGHAR
jgi:hypothetical protein